MTTDGRSREQGGQLFLARPFVLGTRLIIAYPVFTIAVALALAGVACYLTATRLGYQTSRLDLLNPKSNYNRLWVEYIKEFGDEDDAVVVVEGAGREQVVPVLEELSAALAREDRLFHAVLHEVDLGKIRSKGLHYLSPDELAGIDGFLTELGPILSGDWSPLGVGNMAAGLAQQIEAPGADPRAAAAARDKLSRLASSLSESLGQRRRYQSPWPEMPSVIRHAQRAEFRIPADQTGTARLRAAAAGPRQRRLQPLHRGHRRPAPVDRPDPSARIPIPRSA